MAEFKEIGTRELEAYEEAYFDKFSVHRVTGLFRAAARNIQAADSAGWFKEKVDLDSLSPRERATLSQEIDVLYNSFLPFDKKGRPTDPNG